MNVLVMKRIGPIGFSPVAEAYRNYGTSGVLLVMFFTGLILGWIDRWPVNEYNLVLFGAVFLQLLIQVRNDFTPIPMQMLLSVLILFTIKMLDRTVGWN